MEMGLLNSWPIGVLKNVSPLPDRGDWVAASGRAGQDVGAADISAHPDRPHRHQPIQLLDV